MNGFSFSPTYNMPMQYPMQQIRPGLIVFDLGLYITAAYSARSFGSLTHTHTHTHTHTNTLFSVTIFQ